MIMDCSKYVGKCVCGREHSLETKMVVVEYGATAKFEEYMEAVGLAGKRRAVVYAHGRVAPHIELVLAAALGLAAFLAVLALAGSLASAATSGAGASASGASAGKRRDRRRRDRR